MSPENQSDGLRARPAGTGKDPTRLPPWVHTLAMPVWVVGPRQTIHHLNRRAERLFGCSLSDCLGLRCYHLVKGIDADGRSHCGPHCPVFELASRNQKIEPFTLRVDGRRRTPHWIQIVTINAPPRGSRGPQLVHCAIGSDRAHRFEEYLSKVATRTAHPGEPNRPPPDLPLTDREHQILGLLADDMTLHRIADRLDLSYFTVRNHVQHILAKLGVHSIMEAVAQYLLVRE